MSEPRKFPPPWTVHDTNGACFIVKDANGVALAYVYYAEGSRLAAMPGTLTKPEAERMARWIARSTELKPPATAADAEAP
jgi:hypothetical protein